MGSRAGRIGARAVFAAAALLVVACTAVGVFTTPNEPAPAAAETRPAPPLAAAPGPDAVDRLPAPFNVYASTRTGRVPDRLAAIHPRVYVPNSSTNTVSVIDPATMTVIDSFVTGAIPHHITPAPDLSALYVDNEGSGTLTVIDVVTGRPSGQVPITYPYNLYFTVDGSRAVVVAERLRRLEFWDAHTWKQLRVVNIPWAGADHLDFTADGRYLFLSTEYTGMVARVDVEAMQLSGAVPVGGLPVDVRLTPDGKLFYVANQGRGGVSLVDPEAMAEIGFVSTGRGAHGLQVSRDTTQMYVSNRLAGTISVIDIARREVVATWKVGGSPDMMQLSPDGSQLWVSGRYDGDVMVVDTRSGRVIRRIPTGAGAHGLTYFPNAGSISIGHNGVYR